MLNTWCWDEWILNLKFLIKLADTIHITEYVLSLSFEPIRCWIPYVLGWTSWERFLGSDMHGPEVYGRVVTRVTPRWARQSRRLDRGKCWRWDGPTELSPIQASRLRFCKPPPLALEQGSSSPLSGSFLGLRSVPKEGLSCELAHTPGSLENERPFLEGASGQHTIASTPPWASLFSPNQFEIGFCFVFFFLLNQSGEKNHPF